MNYYPNMNYDYIGATGENNIKDYIDITNNYYDINSSNYSIGTSNNLQEEINEIHTNINNIEQSISTMQGTISGIQDQVLIIEGQTTLNTEELATISPIVAADTITLAGVVPVVGAHTISIAGLVVDVGNCLKKANIDSGNIGLFQAVGGAFLNVVYNANHFKDVPILATNREFNLNDTYANLPTTKNNKIIWNYPLNYNDTNDNANIDLSDYYNKSEINNISNVLLTNISKNSSNYASNVSNVIIRNSSNYSSNISNIIIINSSNYASNISNILNINSSNYSSNISNVIIRNSSNYASNISNVLNINLTNYINTNILNLTNYTNTNILNTSNYASNISNVIIINSSNYASNISNVLLINTSNYASNISNVIITNSSNYASNISNVIIINSSNYASNISNVIITNTSNYASNISNVIIRNTSNYTSNISNILNINSSNYASNISNVIITNTSNYASNISNIIIINLSNYTNTNIINSSNYAFNISNFLNINSSNYASNISNVIIRNTSNYASNISNVLNINSSNYTSNISNVIIINTSNYASNISNIIIRNTSNYASNISNVIITNTSNYASNISNVIITNTSNYASNISNVLFNTLNTWTKSGNDIYNTSLNNGNVGIGITNPTGVLELKHTYLSGTSERIKIGHSDRWLLNHIFCGAFFRFLTSRTIGNELAYFGYVDSYDDPLVRTMVLKITRDSLEMDGDIYVNNLANKSSPRGLYLSGITISSTISNFFNTKPPYAAYFAEDFSGNTIPNYIKNGRDATTTGSIIKTTTSQDTYGFGNANFPITFITGTPTSTITFGTGTIPPTFTILSYTRYNGGTRARILTSKTTGNWLHGHWGGNRGSTHYNDNFKSSGTNTSPDNWVCVIGKNSGSTPGNILIDGVASGTATGGAGNYTLGINNGQFTGEYSDFAFNCVMIWDSALTDAEMVLLNNMIYTYKTDGLSLKRYFNDDCLMENREYTTNSSRELLLYKSNSLNANFGTDRIRLKSTNILFDTFSTTTSDKTTENTKMIINSSGNVGIGTTSPNGLLTLYGITQLQPKITLTGQEFYTGTNTNGDGIGLLLGVNRTQNRQLWICDTAQTAINNTNTILRLILGTETIGIDALATDGLTRKSLSIGGDAIVIPTSSYPALRRILKFTGISTSDDIPFMNDLIFNQGAFAGGVFAGDNFISSYWGVSILLNSGGTTNGYGGGDAGRTYDTGWASFNVLMRNSGSSTFNRKLFTIRPNGVMLMYNDVWHITYDGINRFYFASNGTTFISSGGAAGDGGFIVYSSPATGSQNNLVILNNGNTTIRKELLVNEKISIGATTGGYPLSVSAGTNGGFTNVYVRTGYYGGSDYNYTGSYAAYVSASFSNSIYIGSFIINSSDTRIKKEINDIEDDGALIQILAIQPKTYKYIDEIGRGSSVVYGFIAQQVKEVIPLAVEIVKDYIPNIYKLGDCSSNIITLDKDVSQDLNIGDKIKIFDGNNNCDFYNINNINSNVIEIDKDINSSNVFIYGKEINDFHTLKKDYIFSLNVCATQELYKLIQNQNIIIEDLKNRISILEQK